MQRWLLKTEPNCYRFEDLVRDGRTTWDGISNALAQKHLGAMKPGDGLFIYHTGNVRAIIGTGKVVSGPRIEEGLSVVDVAAGEALAHPVTLAQIKEDPAFEGWDLLRLSRLSVVPVPAAAWKRVEQLAKAGS